MTRPFRLLRIWEKKRGDRRTGSPMLASVGEAIFFFSLFLTGVLALTELLFARYFHGHENVPYASGWGMWLVLLIVSSLIAIGAGGVMLTVLQVGASAERRSVLAKRANNIEILTESTLARYPNIPSDGNLTNSPGVRLTYRLPIRHSPGWKLIFLAVFCLVWNGLVVVIGWESVRSHITGNPDWFLTIFLFLFGAVGCRAIYIFAYQLIVTTGIGPTSVELSEHPLRPGGKYRIYVIQGGSFPITSVELLLICDEEAAYLQGTDTRTECRRVRQQRVFFRENIQHEKGYPYEYECELKVPDDVMHSFQSEHNAIHWSLLVKGKILRWPNFERTFPVILHPPLRAFDHIDEQSHGTVDQHSTV